MVAISQIHPRPANFKDMAGSIFVGGTVLPNVQRPKSKVSRCRMRASPCSCLRCGNMCFGKVPWIFDHGDDWGFHHHLSGFMEFYVALRIKSRRWLMIVFQSSALGIVLHPYGNQKMGICQKSRDVNEVFRIKNVETLGLKVIWPSDNDQWIMDVGLSSYMGWNRGVR